MTELLTRRVADGYREAVEEKLQKLAKKAARLGCPLPRWTWGEDVLTPMWRTPEGPTSIPQFVPLGALPREPDFYRKENDLTIEAETIALTGEWTLAAAIDFVVDDQSQRVPIIRTVPGVEDLPKQYQTTTAFCDHCKTDRRRNTVYVVRNAANAFMQVGTDCVETALGVNPALLAAWWKVCDEAQHIGGNGDDDFEYGGGREYYTPYAVVRTAVTAIRLYGWKKADTARWEGGMSGGAVVRDLLTSQPARLQEFYPEFLAVNDEQRAADQAKTEAVLEWLPDMPGDTEYAYNVRTLATLKAVEPRFVGVLGSAVLAHDRMLARAEEAKGFINEPLGEIGKRLTFTGNLMFERAFDGRYGTTHLLVFRTHEGKRVTWFASNDADTLGIEKGKPVTLKATIKKIGERDGVLETQVTRGAVQ